MKINVKIIVGIPGSGKSFFSNDYILKNPNTKRINRDDLRMMLDARDDGNERFIKGIRDEIIKYCILNDRNIIIDDTNCYKPKLDDLIDFIRVVGVTLSKEIEIEILDFCVDFDLCLERNKNREKCLDDKIIYFMKKSKDEINFDELDFDIYTQII